MTEDQTISYDSLQTIRLLIKDGPQLYTKLRHVDIHQHLLRQEAQEGRIKVNWTPTSSMNVDGLAKALSRQKHEVFVRQMNLVDIRDLI